jgi:hypothetical protein
MLCGILMSCVIAVCSLIADGLISHENEEVRERVASLEKKVATQEDEIVCLKSALSDCIRRLAVVESSKGVPRSIIN